MHPYTLIQVKQDVSLHSLVPRPTPSFSMLHAEKREGLVDLVM